ncbi:hypothetical protein Droror1_Dr00002561 [Drosera rotundifolia]
MGRGRAAVAAMRTATEARVGGGTREEEEEGEGEGFGRIRRRKEEEKEKEREEGSAGFDQESNVSGVTEIRRQETMPQPEKLGEAAAGAWGGGVVAGRGGGGVAGRGGGSGREKGSVWEGERECFNSESGRSALGKLGMRRRFQG